MSELERIRRDVYAELATGDKPGDREVDSEFDRILQAAVVDLDPTDEWLEAMERIVESRELGAAAREAAPTNALRKAQGSRPLDLAVLRRASGLSVEEAATRLGISGRAMEQIEGARPMGWVHVQGSAVASYLTRLRLRPTSRVHGVASGG